MATLTFDKYEIEALRAFAKIFHNGGQYIDASDFPRYEEVGEEKINQTIARFVRYGYLNQDSSSSYELLPQITEVVDQLDNPPPRDYWKEVEVWFRSKWWSIPFIGFVVLLPILVQWWEWIRQFFNLFRQK